MTRDELIARIEAGETGPELLCAIAYVARWRFDEGIVAMGQPAEGLLNLADDIGDFSGAVRALEIPNWLTSLDAAVALVGDVYWIVDGFGKASVWGEGVKRGQSRINGNPAAAIVAAWLKATA